ncbi:MAG: hypothetical protein LBG30_03610 [Odoribacteraceae bacterium]|jgi:hypothetical protein|nr:hypothetical protein [Odoribacteraceae bacterium]
MSKGEDWVKVNHLEFNKQLDQTNTYLLVPANLTKMGFITGSPQEDWIKKTYSPQLSDYLEDFRVWSNEATRTQLAIKDFLETEGKMKNVYRDLYMGFMKRNPLVTNHDLEAMGMPLKSTGQRHDSEVAKTHPASRVDTSEPRVLRIFFGTEILEGTSVKRGKPEDQIEAEIWWATSDGPLTNIKDLVNKDVDTSSPYVLSFGDEDRGKCFSYVLRWRNTRGVPGPWSPILSVYIP